jgi:hypothetical protein
MPIQYFDYAHEEYQELLKDLAEKYNTTLDSQELIKTKEHAYYQMFIELWKYIALKCESFGIIARGNFSCCVSCGHGEMSYELEQYQNKSVMTSYVFFHMQVMERVLQQIIDDEVKEIKLEIYWGYFDYKCGTSGKSIYDRFNDVAKKLFCRVVYQDEHKCFNLIIPKNEHIVKYVKELIPPSQCIYY